MTVLKPAIYENGIKYLLVGDYYIPVLKIPEEKRPIGRYGRLHKDYLKEVHPAFYADMVLTCKLWSYLADLNEQAQNRLDTVIRQMMVVEGVTEQLKEHSQMLWVAKMNGIRNRAEEIVLHELIYCGFGERSE